jgi:hypothetical protein
MFHYVTGTPFGSQDHSGAYDDLTMWEQIDEGAQYTPAKKWLICMPIALWVFCVSCPCFLIQEENCSRFLISTHYTHYDPWAFAVNFTALVFVLVAKLPQVPLNLHNVECLLLGPCSLDASSAATIFACGNPRDCHANHP